MTKTLRQLAPGDSVLFHQDGQTRLLSITKIRPAVIYCGIHRFNRASGQCLDEPGSIVPEAAAELGPAKSRSLATLFKQRIAAMEPKDLERVLGREATAAGAGFAWQEVDFGEEE